MLVCCIRLYIYITARVRDMVVDLAPVQHAAKFTRKSMFVLTYVRLILVCDQYTSIVCHSHTLHEICGHMRVLWESGTRWHEHMGGGPSISDLFFRWVAV